MLAPAEFETGSDRWTRTDSGINGLSPDGKWLAIYRRFSPSLSIYRMPGLERVAKLTPSGNFYVYSFEFSPRGDEVAVGSRWGVEFWSTSTWQRTRAVTNFMRILYTPDPRAWWLTKDFFSAGGLYDARTLEPLLLLPLRHCAARSQCRWPNPGSKCWWKAVAIVGFGGGAATVAGTGIGLGTRNWQLSNRKSDRMRELVAAGADHALRRPCWRRESVVPKR